MLPDILTFGPNFVAQLTETPLQIFGIKINYLVIIFTVLVSLYLIYKLKAGLRLYSARKVIKNFALHLRKLEPSTDLRSQIQDYFAQETVNEAEPPLEAPPNMQRLLQHSWQEFAEGMQLYPLGSSQLVNTYQAEDFFNSRTVVKPFMQPLSHVSGLCTSIGLLFTFIALGAGMSGLIYVDMGAPIGGLGDFINALSGKFVTSILGLLVALIVDWLVRSLEHNIEEDLSDIVYQLNRRVRRLTNQSILSEMNASIKAIPENIESFLNKSYEDGGMMAQLKDTIESSLKGVIETHVQEIRSDLEKISTNLTGFGEDGAAQLTEVMKTLGPELKEAISSGVSGDVTQLNETLARLPQIMEASLASVDKLQHSLTESQAMMLNSMKELLSSVSNESKGSLEEVLNVLNENSNNFQNRMLSYQEQQQQKNRESLQTLTEMLNTLRNHQTEYSSQLDQSIGSALEKLEASHAQAQQKANEAFAALQSGNAELLEQMQQSMADVNQKAKSQLEAQQESTEATLQRQKTAVEEELTILRASLLETQKLTQEEMMNGVQHLFQQQNAILTPLLSELQNSFKQFEKVGETLPERIHNSEAAVRSAVSELERFLDDRMKPFIQHAQELTEHQLQLNQENGTQVSKLQALQGTLLGSQENLAKITTSLNSLHQDIVQNTIGTNGTLTRNGELVTECIQKLMDTQTQLDTEYSRLNQLAKDIASTYMDAGESMSQTIIRMQDNAQGFYGELGNETGKLTRELQGAINSLSGTVSQFEEALEDAKLSRV